MEAVDYSKVRQVSIPNSDTKPKFEIIGTNGPGY